MPPTTFTSRTPTIKRILKEAAEITTNPSPDFSASPLETNLFEWHFTLRGPPSPSPYANGLYHGRISLPPTYPLRPPSFRFLTPSGRFEVNREICLSISGHHEETWQPAWGVRTALVALRSFMDTDGAQLGGVKSDAETRKRWASDSADWTCLECGKSNGVLMQEQEEMAGEGERGTEEVPEELKLGYREDLGETSTEKKDVAKTEVKETERRDVAPGAPAQIQPQSSSQIPVRRIQPQQVQVLAPSSWDVWLDKAIMAIGCLLAFLILRRLMSFIV
ncbi:UBC-like protein [Microthyrium microscopicum]|uniref:UBC-like protein n=1 Tax=Microthyrium microscopicum TaxID=703497 RepID=A0A6A6UEC8_9PEZI|nr:UBC-like protein [Microthyrium microscopicum]